jgi:nucleotide-binding universal stress UspA family protein
MPHGTFGLFQLEVSMSIYKRILVPLDGSDTARLGLREALALAHDCGATLRLMHVASEFPVMLEISAVENFEELKRRLVQHAQDMLAEARTLADGLKVPVETCVRELKAGRVADAIVDEARDSGCDLIVIGTHGRRGLSRALVGSDAENVLRHATVPVLLVRDRARAA